MAIILARAGPNRARTQSNSRARAVKIARARARARALGFVLARAEGGRPRVRVDGGDAENAFSRRLTPERLRKRVCRTLL